MNNIRKTFAIAILVMAVQTILAQTVSGVVSDAETNEPLAGVTITVGGTSIATMTNFDGGYAINASQNGKLTFSFVGYTPQTINVNGRKIINIALKEETTELSEIVAIGYGTVKKSDLTGAIGSVSGDKLQKTQASGIDKALQGQLAGVTVNSNSGQPGSNATVRVRGVGTINDPDPWYVVDGLITNNINFLSPSDIQSVEVLKDASAQAIYGSRGANGVILITTKKGTKGKSKITFESYFGVQNRWKKLDVMKRDELAATLATFAGTKNFLDANGLNAWVNAYKINPVNTLYPQILDAAHSDGLDLTQIETDWQDAVFVKDAQIQNHYVSMDGGNDNGAYMLSLNYFDQKGTLIASSYKRLTLRVNTSYQMRKWLKIGENLSFASSSNYNIPGNNQNVGMLYSTLSMAPWDPVQYPAGTMSVTRRPVDLSGRYSTPTLFPNVSNPFHIAFNPKPYNNNIDIVGDIYMEIKPIPELTLRGDVSVKYWDGLTRNFTPVLKATYGAQDHNSVGASLSRTVNMTYEGTATYHKIFAKKHDVTLMLGATAEDNNYYVVNASGTDLLNTDPKNWYVGQTPTGVWNNGTAVAPVWIPYRSGGDGVSKERMVSFLGRLIYNFDDRYLLTASLRTDGSSRLPPEYYWDLFPSVAGAWKISGENFFQPLTNVINSLKLRAGWGRIGNINSIGLNQSQMIVTGPGEWFVGYPLGSPNVIVQGLSLETVPLGCVWERTDQIDIGLDFGMFKNRLVATIDVFNRKTKGMLMPVYPPGHLGYTMTPIGNASDVRNQGIELTLTHQNNIKDFSYNISANASFIKNKLTALNIGNPIYPDIRMQNEGYPLNTIYVRQYDGVFKTQAEIDSYTWTDPTTGAVKPIQPDVKPGDARYVDRNNDGQINDDDRYNAGNPFPTLTYGFNASLGWKGIDLQFFFQGVADVQVYNYLRQNFLEGSGVNGILGTQMRNVFFPIRQDPNDATSPWVNGIAGSDGSIPNPTNTGSTNNKAASSRFVEDASYLRLKNIELGYTFPVKATSIIGVDRLRVYISATNLLTFTKYTGYDPEVGNFGLDWGNYPQSRNLIFGLNINF
ncbi:MAG: TonB-dependent receptor [Paludibacter sp.]|nr:TonB-dependent receptor [Paludibacter sp.]